MAIRFTATRGFAENAAPLSRRPGCSKGCGTACKRKRRLHIFPTMPQLIVYVRDAFLILVPLGGMMYFLVFPDAFDAFLNWMIGMF
jgi:hypothetical protein